MAKSPSAIRWAARNLVNVESKLLEHLSQLDKDLDATIQGRNVSREVEATRKAQHGCQRTIHTPSYGDDSTGIRPKHKGAGSHRWGWNPQYPDLSVQGTKYDEKDKRAHNRLVKRLRNGG